MAQGADMAVASLHKMLPSLTQTAILHATGRFLKLPQINRQTGIFQSSSPSYLLMASMDGCIRLLEEKKEELFAAWSARLAQFDELAKGLKHLRLPGHGDEAGASYPGIFGLDPAKIVISTQNSALNGVELMKHLREDYKIELEMALDRYAVAMTGLGTDDTMPARLAQALLELDEKFGPAEEVPALETIRELPPRKMTIEEAAMSEGKVDFLYDSMGKVCGEYIWAYPPGIPLIVPGEKIPTTFPTLCANYEKAGVHLKHTGHTPADQITVCR
jgi:arginine/lysine/ornithine decarboxylase